MPTLKLTQAAIRKLPNPDKRVDYIDSGARGLYLRVYPTGSKVWRMRYRYRGKQCVLRLGTWPVMGLADAHRAVLDARASLSVDRDPAAAVQKARSERTRMPTVADFVDEYIERHAKPNKKSWETDERILQKDVTPYMGKIALDQVHRRDIVAVLDMIIDRGSPTMAKNTYATIRKMFNFAVERGVIEITPASHIKLPATHNRDVVLTDEAIRHLWDSTASYGKSSTGLPMHHATRLVLRLLLLTGQRSGEVCGLRLAELDMNRQLWLLPGKRTKNGESQTVPLSTPAVAVIEQALETTADKTVLFAASSKVGHLTTWANVQAMERIFNGWEPRYVPHDLRRTVGTRLGELGFNRLIVDKVLNHKDRTIGGVYDRHTYDKEKRAALDAWANMLEAILNNDRVSKEMSQTAQ